MLRRVLEAIGGRALYQKDLRSLVLAVLLTEMGVSIAFPLRMLYAQAHHATPTELGLIASVFFLATIVVQVPLGWLVDRWGRVPVLLLGTAGHACVGAAYIFFSTPGDMIALRILEGACVAAVQPATFAYVADITTDEHRAEAYGSLTSAMTAGLLIGPLFGGMVGQKYGFIAAYILGAVVEIAAVLLIVLSVREPSRHAAVHPQSHISSWRRLITLPLLGAYTAFFTFQVVMGIFSALWSIWIRDLGASYTFIGITFTVFALPQVFLGAIAGRASDRWGRARILLLAGLVVSAIYVMYGVASSLLLILVMGIIEGVFLVFQQPAVQSLLADASPADLRGRAQGAAGLAGAIGGAASSFASLPLYHQNHLAPFVIAGSTMAVGTLVSTCSALLLARPGSEIGALPDEALGTGFPRWESPVPS